ncbi:MAG: ATP-binding protein [Aquisalimonadaceae bacterium]
MADHQDNYDITQPEPAALIESLRAFGYSLKAAVADLVDNSVSAEANNVWIRFEWDGADSYIIIKDDGTGMTERGLISAMRPGSRNPLEERSPKDLGRFGLGLKTASFSQCRGLFVISRQEEEQQVSRCWDLDYINDSGEWRLIKKFDRDPLLDADESLERQGTVVIWRKMDRVVGKSKPNDNTAYRHFLESVEDVKNHMAMVFHRYLEKPSGLRIWINGRAIEAWDPFLKSEKATQELPPEKLFCNDKAITVTPYVLPHQSKISGDTHRKASGPSGWNAQQGFYIYRNERLLVAGEWLGLGFQKEEHYKLARIQVDLPNSIDSEWQIDVKKSHAKPPGPLRADLKRIARRTREQAVQIYRHRGKVTARRTSQPYVFLWQQKVRRGKYFYEINRDHPLIVDAVQNAGKALVEPMLRMLEETVPSAHIMITSAEEPEKVSSPFENCTFESVRYLIESLYTTFRSSGCSHEGAISRLHSIEPFNHRPEFLEVFSTQMEKG